MSEEHLREERHPGRTLLTYALSAKIQTTHTEPIRHCARGVKRFPVGVASYATGGSPNTLFRGRFSTSSQWNTLPSSMHVTVTDNVRIMCKRLPRNLKGSVSPFHWLTLTSATIWTRNYLGFVGAHISLIAGAIGLSFLQRYIWQLKIAAAG